MIGRYYLKHTINHMVDKKAHDKYEKEAKERIAMQHLIERRARNKREGLPNGINDQYHLKTPSIGWMLAIIVFIFFAIVYELGSAGVIL